jgi:hypothetical protein
VNASVNGQSSSSFNRRVESGVSHSVDHCDHCILNCTEVSLRKNNNNSVSLPLLSKGNNNNDTYTAVHTEIITTVIRPSQLELLPRLGPLTITLPVAVSKTSTEEKVASVGKFPLDDEAIKQKKQKKKKDKKKVVNSL